MTSKAQRRRNKKKLPELAPIERKEQPRSGGRFVKREEAANTEPLQARQRVSGIRVAQKELAALHGMPWMGEEIGWCMQATGMKPDALAPLWAAWKGLQQAEETYTKRKVGMSKNARGQSVFMSEENLQVDAAHSIDLRDDEEKLRDATSNWMRWQGYLGHLHAKEASLLRQAHKNGTSNCWNAGKPTQRGLDTLAALKGLSRVIEKRG